MNIAYQRCAHRKKYKFGLFSSELYSLAKPIIPI
jgi:hypothetical protein